MKATSGLQVWAKPKGKFINLKFEVNRGTIRIDRTRKNRPVWYLANFKASLPFKVDFGGGLVGQPKVILKVYFSSKSALAKYRASRNKPQAIEAP